MRDDARHDAREIGRTMPEASAYPGGNSAEGKDSPSRDTGDLVLCIQRSLPDRARKIAQMVGEIPGEVAGLADVPKGQQATYLASVLGEHAESVGGQHLKRGRHHGIQQDIYRLIVDMLRTGETRDHAGLPVDRQGEGEVVVDMGIHTS